MEHSNLRNFLYVAEFKDRNGALTYNSHNHYSCFGAFARVTTPRTGHKFTGRFSFSTNYGSKTARRLLQRMRKQDFKFIFGDKTYGMPKVTYHRADTRGSGCMDTDRLKGVNYYTVTFPLSTPVAAIYSMLKPMFKVICSTQNRHRGTRFMDTLLDTDATFMEITSVISLMHCSGGYKYPLLDVEWGSGYAKGDLALMIKGHLDYEDSMEASTRYTSSDKYKTALGKYHKFGAGLPVSTIVGLPPYKRGNGEGYAKFDTTFVRQYLEQYTRPRKGDALIATQALEYFRNQIKEA